MKKTVALILVLVLVAGALCACGKKEEQTTAQAQTTAAAQEDVQQVEVDYAAEKVKASITLPTLGNLESETDDIDGEGATFVKVYTQDTNKSAYADVELHLTVVTDELKQKTLAGEREDVQTKVEQKQINGYEGCLCQYPEDGERSLQYFLYTTRGDDIVELGILMQDTFSDLTEQEWLQLCEAVEHSAAIQV